MEVVFRPYLLVCFAAMLLACLILLTLLPIPQCVTDANYDVRYHLWLREWGRVVDLRCTVLAVHYYYKENVDNLVLFIVVNM